MNINRKAFKLLINEIVSAEQSKFTREQKTQYELEGEDMINLAIQEMTRTGEAATIVENGADGGQTGIDKKVFLGIGPEALNSIQAITSVGALIISCIILYRDIQNGKRNSLNRDVGKLEDLKKLITSMEEQHMPEELIAQIKEEHARKIVDILHDMS